MQHKNRRVTPQMTRRAAKDTAKKMRLEVKLASKLKRFYSKIATQFKKQLANNGGTLFAMQFEQELRNILRVHYNQVFSAFCGDFSDNLKASIDDLETKQHENGEQESAAAIAIAAAAVKPSRVGREVRATRDEYVSERVAAQSRLILKTIQEDLNSSAARRRSEALAALGIGVLITNNEVAKQAAIDFREKTQSKPDIIAMTETQDAGEEAKKVEAQKTVEIAAGIIGAIAVLRKIWVTVGDSVVRPAHVSADGQEQLAIHPFLVGGEKLDRPGDTSMGASAGNVINCRCSADYFISNPANSVSSV